MKIIKPRFDVGFVFDDKTLAMRKGDAYYINPESMMAKVGDFKQTSRFHVVSLLLSMAVHEVAHVNHRSVLFLQPRHLASISFPLCSKHDAGFATCMTEGMASTFHRELSKPRQSLMKEDRMLRSKALELWRAHRKKSLALQPPKKKRKVSKSQHNKSQHNKSQHNKSQHNKSQETAGAKKLMRPQDLLIDLTNSTDTEYDDSEDEDETSGACHLGGQLSTGQLSTVPGSPVHHTLKRKLE
jgi:hypothetical protein